ncbi:phage major tail tube protein [uncultured Croceicoccus sp.]|uniref:phage major tail tube protein n=1 Tax=uncultured Croceicoccus sp. TaxID=1295329 RepID=UPI002625BDAF|nr:phage major tail tube protein [uncultured Croceicoccus sp.]
MLPAKLKQFNVFNDGASYLGIVKQLELPKLAMASEEYRGAGMLAPVDADMGLEKLTMSATYGGLVVGVLRQFGLTRIDGAMLRFVGAYQADDAGGPVAAELVVRGRHTEIDPGSAEAGSDTEWKVASTLTYLKWTIAGRVEVEIDVLNCVYRVGGNDRMADIRAIIGG